MHCAHNAQHTRCNSKGTPRAAEQPSQFDIVKSIFNVKSKQCRECFAIYSIALRTQKIQGAGARGCRGPRRLPQVVGAPLSLASPVNQVLEKIKRISQRESAGAWATVHCWRLINSVHTNVDVDVDTDTWLTQTQPTESVIHSIHTDTDAEIDTVTWLTQT